MNFGSKCIRPVEGSSHGDLLTCFKCANYLIRYGKSAQNKQRYYCKHCKSTHVEGYSYVAQQPEINTSIISLTKEGCGIRSIARLLQISATTVISRVKKIASEIIQPAIPIGKSMSDGRPG
jgi:insertion element IS1 protein InsB